MNISQITQADQIIDAAGAAGGIEEVRRLAERGWPESSELTDDSPELRTAIQVAARCVIDSVDEVQS